MAEKLFFSSIFGDLTKQIQVVIDEASKQKKELFDKNIFESVFKWDIPEMGLQFSEAIGKSNITIMAGTIGDYSKEPVLSPRGLEVMQEKCLTHAISIPMDVQNYRRVLQLQESRHLSPEDKKKALIELMFGDVKDVVNGVNSKLDYIFLNAISNGGICTLNSTNNPEGGVKDTINYQMPSANKASATTEWTAANVASVDCIQDIYDVVMTASQKTKIAEVWMSQARFNYLVKTPKARASVFGTDLSNGILTGGKLNEYLESNDMPKIRVINRLCNAQNADGSLTELTPFNDKNIVFVPAGQLGVIKNAYTNAELMPEQGVSYSKYGRIQVSKWRGGDTNGANQKEMTKAEAVALPVITQINNIYQLTVES